MKDIMYVLTAAECKSISRAAEILCISQPALSRYISKLERELGLALFERSGEGIRLTDAGVIYVKYAREIMRAKEEMERELKRLCSGRRNISIATTLNTVYMSIPDMQTAFAGKYPECRLTFANIRAENIIDGLRKHQYSFAVGPDSAAFEEDISCEKICEEYLLLMAPVCLDLRPYALKKEGCRYPWLDLSGLPELNLILQEETTAIRKQIDRVYEEYGMKSASGMTTSNSAMAIQAAENQMACCFVSEAFFPYITDKSRVRFYCVGKTVQRTNSCILYLKNRSFTPEERFCMSVVRQTMKENYQRITT